MKNMKRIHSITITQERKGVRSFARINLSAKAEVSLLTTCPMQTIESRCEYGIYPENMAALPEFEQNRLSELADLLHAMGFSKRAIAAASKNVKREVR